jgi:ribosomal protein L6P/L9E
MSRIANNPVALPQGVEVTLSESDISVKGAKGTLAMAINPQVEIVKGDNVLTFAARSADILHELCLVLPERLSIIWLLESLRVLRPSLI